MALSDFLIAELAGQVDMQTVDGRARLAELARPLLGRIPAGVYRELLIESLAESVGLTAPKLERMLGGPASGDAGRGQTQKRQLRRTPGGPAGKPSVVRRAITLLLSYPSAGARLDIEKLGGVNRPGVDLLHDLIETVQSDPDITTAGMLERWRHDEQGKHLGKLAASEVPTVDEFDPEAELRDCLEQLAAAGRRDRVDYLMEKQRINPLTDEEKAELRQLN